MTIIRLHVSLPPFLSKPPQSQIYWVPWTHETEKSHVSSCQGGPPDHYWQMCWMPVSLWSACAPFSESLDPCQNQTKTAPTRLLTLHLALNWKMGSPSSRVAAYWKCRTHLIPMLWFLPKDSNCDLLCPSQFQQAPPSYRVTHWLSVPDRLNRTAVVSA